jgi:hypothetical protein
MKNIINWSYERGTWQYDVLCLLIIAFIFLTPKTWFVKVGAIATQTAEIVVETGDCGCDASVQ